MSYLVDTNVISELRRKQPDANVVAWLERCAPQSLYLSVLTLGEIRKGIERLDDLKRRQILVDWLHVELTTFFLGRLISIDASVADRWGRLQSDASRSLPAIDGLLAATALQYDLTMVTRNLKGFQGLGLKIINPWDV
ncbi:MAG: type II toxin-antitoxin system VapC family toxin [Rhodoferax sp.]|uniref:type II toxin-antitoxin system VapC family toxin n=1 Tax=Rhodoferax sp. TaxID=50421 RepID=UPI001B6B9037|nr:type II toxin-antitoxin system VapC family toxin [Rhodoferax sp.]MBP8191793.1 type II toxin-antitoxin system VapC family toxin [Aquabacterium sp.]MBP9149351.1 type II toxin-antitoxin system VapC family toxin [Rhodoferax sp.]MBP9736800.1 type II toxin-antitoxin system VapC family toxin [Rhodoferax sp.]